MDFLKRKNGSRHILSDKRMFFQFTGGIHFCSDNCRELLLPLAVIPAHAILDLKGPAINRDRTIRSKRRYGVLVTIHADYVEFARAAVIERIDDSLKFEVESPVFHLRCQVHLIKSPLHINKKMSSENTLASNGE